MTRQKNPNIKYAHIRMARILAEELPSYTLHPNLTWPQKRDLVECQVDFAKGYCLPIGERARRIEAVKAGPHADDYAALIQAKLRINRTPHPTHDTAIRLRQIQKSIEDIEAMA